MPVNFASDALYFLLVNSTGDAIADATKQADAVESDINTNEVSGTNYVARGQALTSLAVTQASHVVKLSSANPTWSSATITAYGGWLLKHAATAAGSPLIGYFTFGGSVASTAGTFTVTVNSSGWISVSGG